MPLIFRRRGNERYPPLVSGGGGGDPGEILFAADFSIGTTTYNFGNRQSTTNVAGQSGDPIFNDGQPNCTYTHLATGGRFGGPATRVTALAGRYQYQYGYTTPSFSETWSVGDKRYIRMYMRIGNAVRWDSDNAIKLIDDRGNDGGGERSILYFRGPYGLSGGGGPLGWPVNVDGVGSPAYSDFGVQNARVLPAWWGLSGNINSWDTTHFGEYGCLTMNNEVGFRCCDPVLVSYGNKSACPANPSSTSQSSTDGWLEIQIEQTFATTNLVYYRQWINNNDYDNPSSIIRVFNEGVEDPGLDGTGWNEGVNCVAYCDGGAGSFNENDLPIDIEGFEVGRGFDASWFRG